MVGRPVGDGDQGRLYIVVNAGTKEADFARIAAAAGDGRRADPRRRPRPDRRAGPGGRRRASRRSSRRRADLGFMTFTRAAVRAARRCVVSRSRLHRRGRLRDPGRRPPAPASSGTGCWQDERVRPIGLGARDSLRLEAGLPLYGHDLDETVSPVEAEPRLRGLQAPAARPRTSRGAARIAARARRPARPPRAWACGARRRAGPRRRARSSTPAGAVVGKVTSGGFSPSLGAPIAMGYVPPALAEPGAAARASIVRGKRAGAPRSSPMPFVPHRYHRKPA